MKTRKTILFDRGNGEVAGVANHDPGHPDSQAINVPGPTRAWGDLIAQDPERFVMIGTDAIISGQELRERRKALGMTQETLASILGKSKSIIEKMESDSPSGVPVTGSVAFHIDHVLNHLEGPKP
jgi:hypothetical protein